MRTLKIISLVVTCSCLSACNTFIGMSRDVQVAGENMEKVFRGEPLDAPEPSPPPPPPMQ